MSPRSCVYVYRPDSCYTSKDVRTKYTGGQPTVDFARQCFMYSSYNPDLTDVELDGTWDPVWRSVDWCPGSNSVNDAGGDLGGDHQVYRHAYSTCYSSSFSYYTSSFGHADEISTGIAVFDLDADGMYEVVKRTCQSTRHLPPPPPAATEPRPCVPFLVRSL